MTMERWGGKRGGCVRTREIETGGTEGGREEGREGRNQTTDLQERREGRREGGRERTSRFPSRRRVVEQDAQDVFDEEAEARVAQHQGPGFLRAAGETEGRGGEGGREVCR